MCETEVKIAANFIPDKKIVQINPTGEGHINRTFYVKCEDGTEYILQKINEHIFPNVEGLMNNFLRVTEHIAKKGNVTTLHLVPTTEGNVYYFSPEVGYWRMMDFVKNAYSPSSGAPINELYESGYVFGRFHEELSDFDANTLVEILPNFHNTPWRYENFHKALEKDALGRAKTCRDEIKFYLDHEEMAGALMKAKAAGQLQWVVTHSDTKITNVMLDNDTHKGVCAIDLDTIMPGLIAFDIGDAVRFSGTDAAEDEQDVSKVIFKMESYEAICHGFADARPNLARAEKSSFPMGAKMMTLENGLRFLTDYLDGDIYFHIDYPEHNLSRARTQLKLVSEMEKYWDKMQNFADNL